jgi:hypothetical protein
MAIIADVLVPTALALLAYAAIYLTSTAICNKFFRGSWFAVKEEVTMCAGEYCITLNASTSWCGLVYIWFGAVSVNELAKALASRCDMMARRTRRVTMYNIKTFVCLRATATVMKMKKRATRYLYSVVSPAKGFLQQVAGLVLSVAYFAVACIVGILWPITE